MRSIKEDFHKLIDKCDDTLLVDLYQRIKEVAELNKVEPNWWNELPAARKKYLLEVIEESKDESNLVDFDQAMEDARKWVRELNYQKKRKAS